MKDLHIIMLILIISGIIVIWLFFPISIRPDLLRKAKRLDSNFDKACTIISITSESMNKVEGLSSIYKEGSLENAAYCVAININLLSGIEGCAGMIVTISDNEITDTEEVIGCERLEQLNLK